jgi:predicted RNA-binding Zn ribbon-like protein
VVKAHQVVDGLTVPRPVAGHVALELCNTRAGYDGGPPAREYLESYAHLATVGRATGLLSARRGTALRRLAAEDPDRAHRVLRRAVRFRDSLHAVLTGSADPVQVGVVDRELRSAAGRRRLAGVAAGRARWDVAAEPLQEPFAAFVWQAQLLLQDPAALAQVRSCPGRDCGWLFLDPRGRRRWCIMAICGNREKARRFAARVNR